MINIIKADIYHILQSKVFYITLIIGIGIFTLLDLTETQVVVMGRSEFPPILNMEGGAYRIYYSIGTAKNILFLLLPIYMSLFSKDFEDKIIYNILAKGICRETYFFSKLISILFVSCVTYLVVFFVPMIITTAVNGVGLQESVSVYIHRLLITVFFQMGIVCVIGAVAFYINTLIQKTSAFVMVYIFGILVSGFLFIMAEVNEDFLIDKKVFLEYWLLAVVNNQIMNTEDYWTMILVMLAVLCVPGVISLYIFRKKDIRC